MTARSLVVGKFCPLHQGHELLIKRALGQGGHLSIISYTNPEFPDCPASLRAQWLATLFPTATVLVLDSGIEDVPHNDAPDEDHRQFVAKLCLERLGHTVDAVFTSESYGDGFAQSLSRAFGHPVAHVNVDQARIVVPVSGTAVRSNPYVHRAFLSPVVYACFVKRACLLGAESTGKTTLAEALAQSMETVWVPEYGREMWDIREGKLLQEDMLAIAREQVAREQAAIMQANGWLICDTSPLTTLFYSYQFFGRADQELVDLASRRYEQYFLCAADFPLVQDGTRQDEAFRTRQQDWYHGELAKRRITPDELTGQFRARIERARHVLGSSPHGSGARA